MRMNILVTGADGQLGSELRNIADSGAVSHRFIFTDVSGKEGSRTEYLDITDADAVREDIEGIRRGRKHLAAFLLLLPFVRWVIPSEANFILIGVDSPAGLCSYLASKGIVIRNRSSEPLLEGGVRITIGSAEENRKLEEALVGYVEA